LWICVHLTDLHINLLLNQVLKRRQNYPCNSPRTPIGLWDVEAPTSCRQSAHRWWWGCQPYTPTVLYPSGIFLVLFLLEAE
jgi:hypothetical protein